MARVPAGHSGKFLLTPVTVTIESRSTSARSRLNFAWENCRESDAFDAVGSEDNW